MIVKDDKTLEEALSVLEQNPGGVRYIDRYSWTIVNSPEVLRRKCSDALERGEIAIVSILGRDWENYDLALRKVKRERAQEEKKRISEWAKMHPEEVEKVLKRVKRRRVG